VTETLTDEPSVAPVRREPPRRRPFRLVRHSLVLARRVTIKIRRTPEGLADAVILPIIFLAMFVYLFGGAIEGSTEEYLQFIFPASMVMTVMIAGVMASGLNLNADIKRGIFDRFRSLPIGRSAPLIGSVIGDLVRYLVSLGALFAFGSVLGFRISTDPLSALGAFALTIVFAICLSWGYVLIGIVLREPSAVQGVAVVSLFPLAFATNMVARTDTMPGWLQAWVKVNPVTHVMDANRGLMTEGPVARPVLITLLWSAGFLIVFAPLAVQAYRRRS
jgi:oleandomycin transport system permease protein